jgi:hypothetical protein
MERMEYFPDGVLCPDILLCCFPAEKVLADIIASFRFHANPKDQKTFIFM